MTAVRSVRELQRIYTVLSGQRRIRLSLGKKRRESDIKEPPWRGDRGRGATEEEEEGPRRVEA